MLSFEFDKLHFLNNVFIVCKFLQLLIFFFYNYVSSISFFSTKTQRNVIFFVFLFNWNKMTEMTNFETSVSIIILNNWLKCFNNEICLKYFFNVWNVFLTIKSKTNSFHFLSFLTFFKKSLKNVVMRLNVFMNFL